MAHANQRASHTRTLALIVTIAVVAGGAAAIGRRRATSDDAPRAAASVSSPARRAGGSPSSIASLAGVTRSRDAEHTEHLVVLRSAAGAGERRAAVDALSTARPQHPGSRAQEVVELLDEVSRRDPEPRVRERAVFALSDVAGPESAPRLQELALSDPDANVRSAALANLRLLHERNPEPPKGDLDIRTRGVARLGDVVTVKVTMTSRVDVERARLVLIIPPALEIAGGAGGWEGPLAADQPQSFELGLRIRQAGAIPIFASLRLPQSPLAFESTDRFITLDTATGEVRVETSNR